MKVEIQKEWFSIEQCNQNPNKIYVFGDNDIRRGQAGQAKIRYCKNAFGIPTKRLPSMNKNAFYRDSESDMKNMITSLQKLYKLAKKGNIIVFPESGLGTGLAKMNTYSPKVFNEMNRIIQTYFIDKKEL